MVLSVLPIECVTLVSSIAILIINLQQFCHHVYISSKRIIFRVILCTVSTRLLYWSYRVFVLRVQAFCTSSTEQLYYSCTTAIVSLLHDICKVNMYRPTQRNQKTYDKVKVEAADKNLVKHDSMGDYIWETVQSYEIKEDFIFGHGEKSVYLINKYMKLTDEEAQAIRYHMSSWKHDDIPSVGKVYAANPLAFFLHVADEMATYLDEADD